MLCSVEGLQSHGCLNLYELHLHVWSIYVWPTISLTKVNMLHTFIFNIFLSL